MGKDIKVKDTKTGGTIHMKESAPLKTANYSAREAIHEKIKTITEQTRENGNENATGYATDKVENAMHKAEYHAEQTAVRTKDYAVNRAKEHIRKQKADRQIPQTDPVYSNSDTPAQTDISQKQDISPKQRTDNFHSVDNSPKIKDTVIKTSAPKQRTDKAVVTKNASVKQSAEISRKQATAINAPKGIKTRDTLQNAETVDTRSVGIREKSQQYIKEKQGTDIKNKSVKAAPKKEPSPSEKLQKQKQIKEFAKAKQEKAKAEIAKETASSAPKTVPVSSGKIADTGETAVNTIKTKESVKLQQINDDTSLIKTKGNMSSPVQTRLKKAEINSIRLRSEASEKLQGSIRAKNTLQNKSLIRTKKSDVKNTVLKKKTKRFKLAKAAKERAKKQAQKKAAQEAARRTEQAAKATAKTVKVIAEKVAQAVTAVVKAVASAIGLLGGGAVVLILLIVIAIVGAIAASPFGIFFSDENAGMDTNSIPLSSIVAECNLELSSQLDSIEDNTPHDRVVMEGEQASWDEVIAIFAVKIAGTGDETAEDVVVIDEPKKQKLKSVFWDMNSISSRTETVTSGETTETALYITINSKTKDDMIIQYGFNEKQKEALATLLENNDVLLSATQSLAISDATAQDVLKNLPDTLPAKRKAVIKAGCSLVGKVNYFWGGKSSAIGWDSEWGKMKLVTAEGSRSSGSMRPFGLDCSGYVTWCFINSGFSASDIGHGTSSQVAKGTRISLSSAMPGDLAFYNDISHVGIVCGKDASGTVLVLNCASGANNVVITTGGFGFAVRPNCY